MEEQKKCLQAHRIERRSLPGLHPRSPHLASTRPRTPVNTIVTSDLTALRRAPSLPTPTPNPISATEASTPWQSSDRSSLCLRWGNSVASQFKRLRMVTIMRTVTNMMTLISCCRTGSVVLEGAGQLGGAGLPHADQLLLERFANQDRRRVREQRGEVCVLQRWAGELFRVFTGALRGIHFCTHTRTRARTLPPELLCLFVDCKWCWRLAKQCSNAPIAREDEWLPNLTQRTVEMY